jgi:hypothetical protein
MVPARQATYAGGIHSLELIPGPQKRLKIRALSWPHSRTLGEPSAELQTKSLYRRVLLHNGGSCNACTMKRCITFRCITKQTTLLNVAIT